MPSLYSRVFVRILDSSLAEDWQTRHVFEDLLKLASEGVVDMRYEAPQFELPLEPDGTITVETGGHDLAVAVHHLEQHSQSIVRMEQLPNDGWRLTAEPRGTPKETGHV